MGLADGDVVAPEDLHKLHDKNFKRLLTRMSVGEDVTNGLWAIYGARLGCHYDKYLKRRLGLEKCT